MLRLLFFTLFAVNIAVFASSAGFLFSGDTQKTVVETKPLNVEKIRVRPAQLLEQYRMGNDVVEDANVALDCVNYRVKDEEKVKPFEEVLLKNVDSQQISSEIARAFDRYLVYIAPSTTRAQALARVSQIGQKWQGESYVIMDDKNGLKFAISLGVFKTEDAAKRSADEITRAGVTDVLVGPIGKSHPVHLFKVSHLTDSQKQNLEKIDLTVFGVSKFMCISTGATNQ